MTPPSAPPGTFYLSKGLQKLPIPSTTPEPGSKLPNVSRTFQYVRSIILHLWNPPQPATQLKQALRPAASHPVTFMGRPLHTAIADENSLLSGSIQFIPPVPSTNKRPRFTTLKPPCPLLYRTTFDHSSLHWSTAHSLDGSLLRVGEAGAGGGL